MSSTMYCTCESKKSDKNVQEQNDIANGNKNKKEFNKKESNAANWVN